MGHVFISYSHKDTKYAHGLANTLQNTGLKIWIDERLDYGTQWPQEIQKQLDACDAFIIIMTPRSYASEWVQSELQRAKRKLKPIFPLLLEGDEPWLSVESTQFYDVRGEKLPDEKFYSAIRRVVSVSTDDSTMHTIKDKAQPAPSVKPKNSIGRIIALIGVVATIVIACAIIIGGPIIQKWMNPSSIPDPSETATATSETGMVTEESVLTLVPSTDIPSIVPDSSDASMVLIPKGEFTMGSKNGDSDEKPVHTVYLNDFYIDRYEVTNALYKDCVTAGVCDEPQNTGNYDNSQYADHPVVYVDWYMAKTYCEWRGAQLPTEAQWEKAARGIDERTYPWGEGIACNKANYLGCVGDTKPIGSYESNISPYGVYDMAGNVWEWVADWYSEKYDQNSSAENPSGPDSGRYKVLRGGAWNQDGYLLRTSARLGSEPSDVYLSFGFRCASDTAP